MTVEHLDGLCLLSSFNMPDGVFADDSELVRADPAPKLGGVVDLDLGDLFRRVHIEDLHHGGGVALSSSNCNNVALFVHKDAVGLHVALVDLETLRGIDDMHGLHIFTVSQV